MTTQSDSCETQRKQDFDRNGFVIVRQFLKTSALKELTDELQRYIQTVVPSLPATAAFFEVPGRPETLKQLQHMAHDPYFAACQKQSNWKDLATELLGEDCSAQEPEWFNKPPGTDHVTPPHQDNFYFCLKPPSVVTLWLALDRIDEENGCLRYVAGSHRNGIRPHRRTEILGFSQGITDFSNADRQKEVSISLEPGDLLAHHGETIHRAEANRSAARHRRAFAMVYRGDSCQRDEEAFARYQADVRSQHRQVAAQQQQ